MTEGVLQHTPGVFYAWAYWFSACLSIWMSPKRLTVRLLIGVQIGFLLILTFLMTISDGITIIFLPMMFLYMSLILYDIRLTCRYDVQTSIYFAVRTFIIGEFIASLAWQVTFYMATLLQTQVQYTTYAMGMVVTLPLVMLSLYFLEKELKAFNNHLTISRREMLSTLIIGVAVFVISNLSYVVGESVLSVNVSKELFLIRTLVDFAGVALLNAYHFQISGLKARTEKDKLQDMLATQHTNYAMLEQSMSVVNQKYHDLKYQIQAIREGMSAEEGQAYLDQVEKEIKLYEAQNRTGNSIVDTILTGKPIQCQLKEIEFTTVVDGQALDFLDAVQLMTLLGNMLDNAIESTEKITDKQQRLIHLVVTKTKGFVRIRLENRFEGTLEFVDNLPKTTKGKASYHGFGLKSIRSILQQYDGSLDISTRGGWFELSILFPPHSSV
ncbi:sensor histidine kinase [Streptococcus cuniculi]|uniref:GHKL domain-containing protein n=1 Tax=Streptococcus cuniculi TaxID=1432788 RepID=A0A4Y9JCC5_9STRE|nr:sensor histidine kinase [Streptococcus cuniculi]MBF0777590.1 GHKL domain-containing protein [Streptococcus cuniculi]TFU98633.1 GHKL domain-containing protein [Streptococcus cuniculi]